jgi:hypothetical protein
MQLIAATLLPGCLSTVVPGAWPAGGRHDHTNSPYYKPPHFQGDVTEVLAGMQIGATYMNPNGTVKIEVLTFDVTGASVRVTST